MTEHEQSLEPRMNVLTFINSIEKKKSGCKECFSCSSCLIKDALLFKSNQMNAEEI